MLLMVGIIRGGEAAAVPVRSWPAVATIRFAATSTLHDFGGELSAQPFTLMISNGNWSAEADVLVGEMKTANEKRDLKMYQMFNTNRHPRLRGIVGWTPIPPAAGTNITVNLTIREGKVDLPVRVTDWQETAEEIRFHAAWEVSLRQFGLKPPSVLGVIRVGDRVKLNAVVTAQKTNPPHAVSIQQP
jgi:polyisoprenoid-binding protein YceI